jgi:hypothetical protein
MTDRFEKIIRFVGIPLAIAALFYFAYARYYDGVAVLILGAFFTYFRDRLGRGMRHRASLSAPPAKEKIGSPLLEIAKALGCLLGAAIGVGIAMTLLDGQLGLAFALTCTVTGVVAFMMFLMRAAGF